MRRIKIWKGEKEGGEYDLLPTSASLRPPASPESRWGRAIGCIRHGEWSVFDRHSLISRSFAEKFSVLLDELQVCAVLWVVSCPGATRRFPTTWCQGASFLPFVNLDFPSVLAYEIKALNSTITEEDVARDDWEDTHAIAMLCGPGILVFLLGIYFRFLQNPLKRRLRKRARFVPPVERALLGILYLIFLPWHLFASRHTLCVEMQALVDWQMKFTCGRLDESQLFCEVNRTCPTSVQSHWSWLVLACMVIYTVGLPLAYISIAAEGAPFDGNGSHEKWLRSVEGEYVMQVSSVWSHRHYALFSSFTRRWLYFYPISLFKKLALAWIATATYGRQTGDAIRDLSLLSILWLWFFAILVFPCFRMQSTQMTAIAAIAANALTSIPRALMSIRFESEVWFYLGLLLPFHHSLAAFFVVAIIVATFWFREEWPTNWKSIREEDNDVQEELADFDWDEFESTLSNDLSKTAIFADEQGRIRTLQQMLDACREVLIVERLRTPEFVRLDMLSDALRQLDSLVMILKRKKHCLGHAFEDVMEDMISFYNEALQTTVYNYPPLMPIIPELRIRMDTRDRVMGLSGPVRKRLLLKLFAIRQFQLIRREVAHRKFVDPFAGIAGIVMDSVGVDIVGQIGAGLGLSEHRSGIAPQLGVSAATVSTRKPVNREQN